MTRACSDCGATIGARNASGFCKRCHPKHMALDPTIRANQRAGIARKMADPAYREAHVARCIANGKRVSDEVRAKRVERGREMAATVLSAPEVRERWLATRAQAGKRRSETVLAWCPPEYRDIYRDLKKRGRTAAEARRIVRGIIAGVPHELYQHQKAQLAWCPEEWRSRYHSLRSRNGAARAREMIEDEMRAAKLRSLSPIGAAGFLKPLAPLYRCDERGQQAATGARWRFGNAILSNDELIERALRKGWQPMDLAA